VGICIQTKGFVLIICARRIRWARKACLTHGPSLPQKANLSVDNVAGQSLRVQTEIASILHVVTRRAELKFRYFFRDYVVCIAKLLHING
jgi:hypothetical protein